MKKENVKLLENLKKKDKKELIKIVIENHLSFWKESKRETNKEIKNLKSRLKTTKKRESSFYKVGKSKNEMIKYLNKEIKTQKNILSEEKVMSEAIKRDLKQIEREIKKVV